MKILSWNVNGLRAACGHGLLQLIDKREADIYAFQETKVSGIMPSVELEGYYCYWSFCTKKKGYAGTLVMSAYKPVSVIYGFGESTFDTEGRTITLEFPTFYLVNCYVPNSQGSPERLEYRKQWDEELYDYVQILKKRKHTIICGDFNTTASNKDIYDGNKWHTKSDTGFETIERENLLHLINSGYVDTFRYLYPNEEEVFTWWSNRLYKRDENRGWRLDYIFASEELEENIVDFNVMYEVYGSDHCPIQLEIRMPGVSGSKPLPPRKARFLLDDIDMDNSGEFMYALKRTDLSYVWDNIDWNSVEEHVAAMQMLLSKAASRKDKRSMEFWQRRISFSIDSKVLAVRHVCNTANHKGIDNVSWDTSHDKIAAALSLTSKGYKAHPSKYVKIHTKNGKERGIAIQTYYDRAMQTLYAYALDPIAEACGDRKSFAFRKGRSAFDLHNYILMAFEQNPDIEWLFVGDVRQCYENISHQWIIEHIPLPDGMLKEFLKGGFVMGGELFPSETGVPTGATLSPIVANMTLDGLQDYIYKKLYSKNEKVDFSNGNLLRYADDILVTARTKEDAIKIQNIVKEFLAERGLELSKEKSYITNIKDGFSFMSRTYRKENGQVRCYPSEKAVNRFMEGMRDFILGYSGSQEQLIKKINKKIDGWVTYHKVEDSYDVFNMVDVHIQALLLEMCQNKHPRWYKESIINRYWYKNAKGDYCFSIPNKREISVKSLRDTILVRHHAVRTNFNPYVNIEELAEHKEEGQIANVTGFCKKIWNRQDGKCFYCERPILRDQQRLLVEVDHAKKKKVCHLAYVHKLCEESSIEYCKVDVLPDSGREVSAILTQVLNGRRIDRLKYLPLDDYFRTATKAQFTLTISKIEEILGQELEYEYYKNEGIWKEEESEISESWIENGYSVKFANMKKQTVTFKREFIKNGAVKINEVFLEGKVPLEAKYEFENYQKYLCEKYGL